MEPTQEKKSYGALIGSVIIIVILVLGGIYFWMSKQNNEMQIQETQTPNEESSKLNAEDEATASELSNLEAELEQGASLDTSLDVSAVQ
ncbi:MAG: hypothetical protein KBC12_00100 [Candidatus Pacebacteria bacterium]|nr:hypothetical protein [Candidatus Paceibacterota bacterium]